MRAGSNWVVPKIFTTNAISGGVLNYISNNFQCVNEKLDIEMTGIVSGRSKSKCLTLTKRTLSKN